MQSLTDTWQPNARIFPDWSGKVTFSPDARNYFPKPGIYQNHAKSCFSRLGPLLCRILIPNDVLDTK